MKRLLSLALALMAALVILAGCTVYAEKQERNSRAWIEDQLSVVDKVYPTENLFDLFEKFPDGFSIRVSDAFKKGDKRYYRQIILNGYASERRIGGLVTLKDDETEIANSQLSYSEDGTLSLENEVVPDELLPYKTFLFQKLTLNKDILSSMKMISKSYSWQSEIGNITYSVKNSDINKLLNLSDNATVTMDISLNPHLVSGNQYIMPITYYQDQHVKRHSETIRDYISEDINE